MTFRLPFFDMDEDSKRAWHMPFDYDSDFPKSRVDPYTEHVLRPYNCHGVRKTYPYLFKRR